MAHSALVYVEVLRDLVAVVAADDAPETRTVYAVVTALGLIGVALVLLAIWLVRQTRPERELLAPLERMNDRAWRKQEPAQMRRDLDEVRPPGARPVVRGQDLPEVDADFDQNRPAVASFDDLQAQQAAAARRRAAAPSGPGHDPLLPLPTAEPGAVVAGDGVGEAVPDPEGRPRADAESGVDRAAGPAETLNVDTETGAAPRSEFGTNAADGTVTHTGGSPEIAALVAPALAAAASDDDVDSPPEDSEPAKTDAGD